jgi:excisionase family DNA binding protein
MRKTKGGCTHIRGAAVRGFLRRLVFGVRGWRMMNDIEKRLLKMLTASAEQLAAIDRILEGRPEAPRRVLRAPVLVNMGTAAAFLGVSRATLWRMIKAGRLERIEVFQNSFRVRREDLEALAGYDEDGRVASRSRFHGAVPVVEGL